MLEASLKKGDVTEGHVRKATESSKECSGLTMNDELQNCIGCAWVLLREHVVELLSSDGAVVLLGAEARAGITSSFENHGRVDRVHVRVHWPQR